MSKDNLIQTLVGQTLAITDDHYKKSEEYSFKSLSDYFDENNKIKNSCLFMNFNHRKKCYRLSVNGKNYDFPVGCKLISHIFLKKTIEFSKTNDPYGIVDLLGKDTQRLVLSCQGSKIKLTF